MFFYNLVVRLYALLIRLASVRNDKARQWVSGRRHWREDLSAKLKMLDDGPRYWVHCASYGEFEQGRPLMEKIKSRQPGARIVLSFFSPSGYEPFKSWAGADIVCYLPLDTRRNARDFLALVKPQTILFIKYEFWVNFLNAIAAGPAKAYLVSAVFKPHHPFFKWYGGLFRRSLRAFQRLFIQDDASGRLLQSAGISHFEVTGDTRFDRVVEIRSRFTPLPLFENFTAGKSVIVAGSTWPGDEKLLLDVLQMLKRPYLKTIVAPHNVDEKHIGGLKQQLSSRAISFCCYSDPDPDLSASVMIVDTIGLLSRLYHYADVAYVGGGFDGGIHNCLEPAVFLKPVLFYGEGFEKYNEAVELINIQAAKNVLGVEELESELRHYLDNADQRDAARAAISAYFGAKAGATERILSAVLLP